MKSFCLFIEAKLGLEATDQIWHTLTALKSNLYSRTRPLRPTAVGDRKTPMDHFRYWPETMPLIRDWITRNNFPVSLKHLDATYSAMADAMIDLNKHQGDFTPATYHKGADPSSAEHLQQFAQMLRKRLSERPVPHPILTKVADEWDAFLDDFWAVYQRLKQSGELPEQV